MRKHLRMWLSIATCIPSLYAFPIVVHVAANGADSQDGSQAHPVATLERALEIARQHAGEEREIRIGDGIFYLSQTLILSPEDNGLVMRAENAGRAIVSGGQRLHLKWKRGANNVWSARVKQLSDIDQLYIDGKRQRMARYPNASDEPGCNIFDVWRMNGTGGAGVAEDALSPQRIARWKNPVGGYIHAMHLYLWGDMHWEITEKIGADSIAFVGGWQNNRPSPMHGRYRFVENVAEELDAPGEWFYDEPKHILYYYPQEGTEMDQACVEVVRLKHLVELQGTPEVPVRDIDIQGLVFRHAARTFMENKERLLRSDWTIYRGGAVVYRGAEDCTMRDCEFDQVGGNTVFVDGYNRRIHISGCYIHESGANGICFVGDSTTVRSPRYDYADTSLTDTVMGPRSDNYPAQCSVYDCLITRTGRDEKQTSPIQISMAYGIHVDHCSIYEVPRAGINISEGTFGGHIIENCDVFDTVLETGDHGSFNSWGRDRYWVPDIRTTSNFLLRHPGAEHWDMIAPNVLRHNRMRCDHGWDIDLDDGSSNYIITENLMLNGGLKLREGKNRIATNNIIVNNSLHLHVWYAQSGDVFMRNIVCKTYQHGGMDEHAYWGWQLDANFFACGEDDMRRNEKNGCDLHSLCGNPMFVNPAGGDFRVQETSGALRLGFHNFRMDNFGVVSPKLRAKARVPQMPAFEYVAADARQSQPTYQWRDIVLQRVEGDALSAYGVDLNIVGLTVVSLGDAGANEKHGLRVRDLIVAVNGVPIDRKTDVGRLLRSQVKRFTVFRNQEKIEINL